MTAHSKATGSHTAVISTPYAASADGFHTYGVLWTKDTLVWYFDNTEVARTATPSDMNKPMYMLVNLAVGGMAGAPADHLATPAEMQTASIADVAIRACLQTFHTGTSRRMSLTEKTYKTGTANPRL
jgi:beta-glucanase (GH16 family)